MVQESSLAASKNVSSQIDIIAVRFMCFAREQPADLTFLLEFGEPSIFRLVDEGPFFNWPASAPRMISSIPAGTNQTPVQEARIPRRVRLA